MESGIYQDGIGRMTSTPDYYLNNPVEPMPSALLENTIVRLDRITNLTVDANNLLTDLRSRTFGPWPEAGQAASSNLREASPPSQQGRVGDMLDRLERAVRTALDHAQALNISI